MEKDESSRKEASSRQHGTRMKAWTKVSSWYQRDKLITALSPADLHRHPIAAQWHTLSAFNLLEKIYSTSTAITLNRVIIVLQLS